MLRPDYGLGNGWAPTPSPNATDDVLGIIGEPGWEIAGSRDYVKYASGVGYACVRTLKAPHPGEPGGGSMDIDVGECLEASDTGEKYEEVPCEGAETAPDGKIVDTTDAHGKCPRPDDTVVVRNSLGFSLLDGLGYCLRAYTQP
ncbi:hypothetical protein ACWD4O_20310 [Streptomyces sp. NPDC002623]